MKAVNYITDLKKSHGVNIVATNNSWGGGGYLSDVLRRLPTHPINGVAELLPFRWKPAV